MGDTRHRNAISVSLSVVFQPELRRRPGSPTWVANTPRRSFGAWGAGDPGDASASFLSLLSRTPRKACDPLISLWADNGPIHFIPVPRNGSGGPFWATVRILVQLTMHWRIPFPARMKSESPRLKSGDKREPQNKRLIIGVCSPRSSSPLLSSLGEPATLPLPQPLEPPKEGAVDRRQEKRHREHRGMPFCVMRDFRAEMLRGPGREVSKQGLLPCPQDGPEFQCQVGPRVLSLLLLPSPRVSQGRPAGRGFQAPPFLRAFLQTQTTEA